MKYKKLFCCGCLAKVDVPFWFTAQLDDIARAVKAVGWINDHGGAIAYCCQACKEGRKPAIEVRVDDQTGEIY